VVCFINDEQIPRQRPQPAAARLGEPLSSDSGQRTNWLSMKGIALLISGFNGGAALFIKETEHQIKPP
jgi:hypothetical protein